MRKITYLLLLMVPIYLVSCKKKSQAQIDSEIILNYISTHHLNAVAEPNGVYFVPGTGGNGLYATSASVASVTYKGYLTNDSVFDQKASPYTFYLQQIIPGLQEGIPLMQRGQKATFLIPSAMAYGSTSPATSNGYATIPANSVLIFDIDLISFQ